MRRFIESLRALRNNQHGSMPLQYALVAALAMGTVLITQSVTSKVADKLNAVKSVLNKVQF